jgi:hypothetical protein
MGRLLTYVALAGLVTAGSLGLVLTRSVPAQSTNQVTSAIPDFDEVREDWQLVVATPDLPGVGPQITTMMSPIGDNVPSFVAFNMNYRDAPFRPGGLQIQVWYNKSLTTQDSDKTSQLSNNNETITWTQRMALQGGRLYYAVDNGQSSTWGKFGEGDQLDLDYATTTDTLSAYNPDKSAKTSGVTWQANNVTSMQITQVRYYKNGNVVYTDNTTRSVNLGQ